MKNQKANREKRVWKVVLPVWMSFIAMLSVILNWQNLVSKYINRNVFGEMGEKYCVS